VISLVCAVSRAGNASQFVVRLMTVPVPRSGTNVSVGGSFLFLRRTKEGAVDGQGGDDHSDGRLQDIPYAIQGDDPYAKSIFRS